jgi:DNA polymerase III alpha subunit
VYIADDRRAQTKGKNAHLTLLAADNSGYSNLIELTSTAYLEGYYYKPRVDWELLQSHGQGLIALSGCLSGRVCKALEEQRPADAAADLDRLVQTFGRDNTYVEMQNAHLEPQQRINPQLAKLAEGTGLGLVATGDVHYLKHEDARAHERSCASSPATRSRTRSAGASSRSTSTSSQRSVNLASPRGSDPEGAVVQFADEAGYAGVRQRAISRPFSSQTSVPKAAQAAVKRRLIHA